jgi:GT2 family glycosyltransferase
MVCKTQGLARVAVRAYQVFRKKPVVASTIAHAETSAASVHRPTSASPGLPPTEAANDPHYACWIRENEPGPRDLDAQRHTVLDVQPKITVVIAVCQPAPCFLNDAIESIRSQTYACWELCVVDSGGPDSKVRDVLTAYAAADARIKVKFLEQNEGVAGNSNAALSLVSGAYVCFLHHDDTLAPFALFEVAQALNRHPEAWLLYSDDDQIDAERSVRFGPRCKPDWSPDTLRSHNYIGHLAVIRRDVFGGLGGFSTAHDGAHDYDLFLKVSERAGEIVHIPKILYHVRAHLDSMADGSPAQVQESAKRALREHLQRCKVQGTVDDGPHSGTYRIEYRLSRRPLVSIIIPNRDNHESLDRCLRSVFSGTYDRFEVIVVENNSRDAATFEYYRSLERHPCVKLYTWNGAFNYSRVNNFGAAQSQGEVLLFLNNDVEAINADWLERMLEHGFRPDVGAVGAKLYYADDTIQHGGVVLRLRGIAAHAHQGVPRQDPGYLDRLVVTQNFSAVTAACLLTRRHVFEEVGGFDERYALAFNDVDWCVKVRRRGYLIVWTPYAELYHYESKTRGSDDTPTKRALHFRELNIFARKWPDILRNGDPYYNPNLTLLRSDFSLRLKEEEAIDLLAWVPTDAAA